MLHDDVIKWGHFPRYWPSVGGIHRSPVNSPHKGQWRRALMCSMIGAWINGWVNNREAGDLRRYRVLYDIIVMDLSFVRSCGAPLKEISLREMLKASNVDIRLITSSRLQLHFEGLNGVMISRKWIKYLLPSMLMMSLSWQLDMVFWSDEYHSNMSFKNICAVNMIITPINWSILSSSYICTFTTSWTENPFLLIPFTSWLI